MLAASMRRRVASDARDTLWARLTGTERRFRLVVVAIASSGALLRVANVALLAGAWGYRQILDAAFYHDEACYLAGVTSTPLEPSKVRFANPGYSEILAWAYRLFGADERVGLMAQAVLAGVTTVLLAFTARSLFSDRRAGVIAALLWALYVPAIYYDGVLLTPSLTALLTALCAWAMAEILRAVAGPEQSPRRALLAWALVAGSSVGVAALLRPSNALLGLGLVILLLLRSRSGQPELRTTALAFSLAVTLVVAPRIAAQHASSGDWLPLSANGGMNLWIGNGPDADGTYVTASFIDAYPATGHPHTVVVERNAYLGEARRLSENPELGLAQASAFWRQRAVAEIAQEPLRALGLELKKLFWFWNRYESRTNVSLAFLEHFSAILRFDPLGFGIVAVLAGYGLLTMSEPELGWSRLILLALIAAPLVGCLIFFVSGEYRHPASGALVIAASFGLSRLTRGFADVWPKRRAVASALSLLALAVLVLYPVQRPSDRSDAKAYAEWLVTVHPDGQPPTREAYEHAEVVLGTLGEDFADRVLRQQTLLLLYANQATQFPELRTAQLLISTASELWHMDPVPSHGIPEPMALRVHDDLFQRVRQLASQPFSREHPAIERRLALLGSNGYREIAAYLQAGRWEEARVFATEAVELAPSSTEALAERGRVELLAGNTDAALPWLSRSFDAWPKRALPAVLLCELAVQARDPARAVAYLREASLRDPADPDVLQLERLFSRSP
jgi:4-amino-4-deoxy-L-arabinose transferase-like glycosyltransferase